MSTHAWDYSHIWDGVTSMTSPADHKPKHRAQPWESKYLQILTIVGAA